MESMGIRHCHSAAYNSQSNGAAEKGVGQIKTLLSKMGRKGMMNQEELNQLVFKINSHQTSREGSALERFYGRSVRTYQPELVKKKIHHQEIIAARGEKQRKIADKLGRRSKDDFKEGDDVLCQDMSTKRWTIKGKIVEGREAEDGSVRSFVIKKENGRTTIRNSRHLKFQATKEKYNVSFSDDLVEVIADSDYSADEADVETSSSRVTTADESPGRASARLAQRAQTAY